jgi:PAS domain S-box-containing protein
MALVSLKDRHGRFLFVNRRFAEVVARDRDDVIGRTDREVFPESLAASYRANDLAVLNAGTPVEFEEAVPHAGELHTYVAIKFPLAAGGEHPYALCSIATDITARKRIEQTLAERTRALETANADLEAFNYSVSRVRDQTIAGAPETDLIIGDQHRARIDQAQRQVRFAATGSAKEQNALAVQPDRRGVKEKGGSFVAPIEASHRSETSFNLARSPSRRPGGDRLLHHHPSRSRGV